LSEIHFEEGLTIQQYAAQLVHLLCHSANGADSLARAPLIEHLKQQADEQPSNGNPHDTIVWQLTGADLRQTHWYIWLIHLRHPECDV